MILRNMLTDQHKVMCVLTQTACSYFTVALLQFSDSGEKKEVSLKVHVLGRANSFSPTLCMESAGCFHFILIIAVFLECQS
jgi:hypothetical protein